MHIVYFSVYMGWAGGRTVAFAACDDIRCMYIDNDVIIYVHIVVFVPQHLQSYSVWSRNVCQRAARPPSGSWGLN